MKMDVLLPIVTYPDPTPRAALGQTLTLAARIAVRVSALVQEVDIAPIHSALGEAVLGVSRMAADAEAASRTRAADIKIWMEKRAEGLDFAIKVQTLRCRPEGFAEALMPAARRHDLTIMVLDANDPQRRADTEALIFGSGSPVVVVPAVEVPTSAVKEPTAPWHIALAWDGSRAASRALRDAMPILALADIVSIITVEDDKAIAASDIAGVKELLEHHGIRAKHLARIRGAAPIGETLQAIAVGAGADLLVMGAYGHNRLQEFVLGGATRTILRAPRLPILLAH